MADGYNDAFILFNIQDTIVETIVPELEKRGIICFFWKHDIPAGDNWKEKESENIEQAKSIVIFLGDSGWGPTQRALTENVIRLEKKIIPVLIGNPPSGAFKEFDSLFENRRYIDLRSLQGNDFSQNKEFQMLVDTLSDKAGEVDTSQFDAVISTLVDGNEEQRVDVLNMLSHSQSVNRPLLFKRINMEIETGFSAAKERDLSSSLRDPGKISSIRSWMLSALVECLPESLEGGPVVRILNYLERNYEPDINVRYWLLASLYRKKVPFLHLALNLAGKESTGVVRLLADTIINSGSPEFIERLRNEVRSSDCWEALRVLRVVPVSMLTADVCQLISSGQLGDLITYDAFYAIAHPEMSKIAASIFEKEPGTKTLIDILIRVLKISNPNAARDFSFILLAFKKKEVDEALTAAKGIESTRGIAIRLSEYVNRFNGFTEEKRDVYLPGFSSDSVKGQHDDLGVKNDARILTAVMLAKDVNLPLAIGLFGNWGTGKSFFMESMQEEVRNIQERDQGKAESPFCTSTLQIIFNAWYYADTNLWASLVSNILERLAAYVAPQATSAERESLLISELDTTKLLRGEAEAEKIKMEGIIERKRKELQELIDRKKQNKVSLLDLRRKDFLDLLTSAQRTDLDKITKDLGIPAVISSMEDLEKVSAEIGSTQGKLYTLITTIVKSRNWLSLTLVLLTVLAGIPLAAWAVHRYLDFNGFIAAGAAISAQVVVLFKSVKSAARRGLAILQSGVSAIERIRIDTEKKLEEKRNAPSEKEIALIAEMKQLSALEEQARLNVSAATEKAAALEEKIRILKDENSLNHFLSTRTGSDDYKKHLGLISVIRKDFESLSEKLANPSAESTFRKVDRIILYIDDLDRCPPEKVMDILEAVHLLLAFPLFVVVVGVDPGWLLHSLTMRFSAFREKGVLNTTPQKFLEKIFQVPYSLKPMNKEGFGKLINGLFIKKEKEPAIEISTANYTNRQLPLRRKEDTDIQAEAIKPSQPAVQDTAPQQETPVILRDGKTETEPVPVYEKTLIITAWESSFAEKLYYFIPTPRTAKRFANVYRILKASVTKEDLIYFEGSAELPGHFQVAMLLLAVITGTPAEFIKTFHEKNIIRAINKIHGDEGSTVDAIKQIINLPSFPKDESLFTQWLPLVSRFSFETVI